MTATTSDIRQTFLDFFARADHKIIPSSSLVPHNDPTLMFTNAGMNQFKNIFTGVEKAPEPPRATTAQKVVRAGGKHNDLDNVGYTARHHTFFEMLGNFSFADYFKEQAITFAWELLTKDYGLAKDKLYFTVYHTDDEAFSIWKKVTGCDDGRILRIPTSDNFWTMGDVGPCGPCSEIFYDHGVGNGQWALDSTGHDLFDERYVEIWNLVFMQYEQRGPDERIPLPKPCVDTGMGLERMATVLQGKHDNYDIDLFRHLIEASESLTRTKAQGDQAASHKVIADHLRSSCFLIADGVLPSNEGRGYVLRRIMRRAMRHAHLLGAKDPLMHRLVPALINEMGGHYQELKRAEALMTETLKSEEVRFKQTLERGLKLLDEARSGMSAQDALPGEVAFKLYDTYGFPLDLTQDIMRGEGGSVDLAGFDAAMNEQKNRARAAWSGSGEQAVSSLWYDIKERHGATEFLGYQTEEAEAVVMALVKDGAEVAVLKAGESGSIVINQTPFYAESGGQMGDVGTLRNSTTEALVTDCMRPVEGLYVHAVTMEKGELKAGDRVQLQIDGDRRARIKANHSATHILHAVLRAQLGEHITQKGSLVAPDRLRFDISHPKAISAEELSVAEAEVNRVIWENSAVNTKLMGKDDAIAAGAMAMFGEKYDDEVRVLSMGIKDGDIPFSIELCGGTHVSHTGDIGLFTIISESAVAAGVRRIEALTRDGAYAHLKSREAQVRELAQSMKIASDEVPEKVAKLLDDKKQLEKQLAEVKKQLALGGGASGGSKAELTPKMLGDVSFIGASFQELPPKELRDLVTNLAQQHGNSVVALASSYEGKASIIVASGIASVDAPHLVRLASAVVGGQGGGGKPNFAQAGGPEADKIAEAIAAIEQELNKQSAA